jgi:hypothetical protein
MQTSGTVSYAPPNFRVLLRMIVIIDWCVGYDTCVSAHAPGSASSCEKDDCIPNQLYVSK